MGRKLLTTDRKLLDQFVAYILDKHKSGEMDRDVAVANLSHLVIATDNSSDDASDPVTFMRSVMAGDHE